MMTDESEWLDRAVRAEPGSPGSGTLREWLDALDDERWAELLPVLESIADEVPSAGVLDGDDRLGELVVLAHERWIPKYREALAQGAAKASLRSFLKLRLRRHVAELRRKALRRRELLRERGPDVLGRSEEAVTPYDDAVAEELLRKAGGDEQLRAVLALRVAGFNQREIASMLDVSRPTVTRRVAVLATILAGLLVVGLAFAWWSRTPEGVETPTIAPDVPLPPRPAGSERVPEPMRPAAPEAEEPEATPEPEERIEAEEIDEERIEPNPRVDAEPARPRARRAPPATEGEPNEPRGRADRWWSTPGRASTDDAPSPFVRPEETPEGRARECSMRGDNQCVIDSLENGRARTPVALAMLIEAYRARGQNTMAQRHMRVFVQRYPSHPRAEHYRQVMEHLRR